MGFLNLYQKYLKPKFSDKQSQKINEFYRSFIHTQHKLECRLFNRYRKYKLNNTNNLHLHLGCGDCHLNNFVNIDTRVALATDVTNNLNILKFKKNSSSIIFSKSFFEHLYRFNRIPHLESCYNILNDAGVICYIGIPYFKNIAKFYLEKSPGTSGPIFDLYNVYRYTHGDPDRMYKDGWYFEQLHKSLFDEEEIKQLLINAGFKAHVIFSYAFPDDFTPLNVVLGFFASKKEMSIDTLKDSCLKFLDQFRDKRWYIKESITFIK